MKTAYEHFKIVCEPGAAVGLAAILNEKLDIKNKNVEGDVAHESISITSGAKIQGTLHRLVAKADSK